MMIRANGYRGGEPLSVSIRDGIYEFNGERDAVMEYEFKELLKKGYPVMGTYIPEDVNESAYICGVLSEWYFDEWVKVDSDVVFDDAFDEEVVY